MRLAYACAALLVTAGPAGCATLIGIDAPKTDFEISRDIAGRYLVAVDVQTAGAVFTDRLEFFVTVGVDDLDDRVMSMGWIPLEQTTRVAIGDAAFAFDEVEIENLPELDWSLDPFDVVIPASASTSGQPLTLDAVLDAVFPILDEELGPITSGFCGDLRGQITSNKAILQGTTFGAVKVETGAPLPRGAVRCEELGAN
jgi:hypothetical protein